MHLESGRALRERTMLKFRSMGLVAAVLCAAGGASAMERIKKQVIPDFAPTDRTGWVLDRKFGVDDLVPSPTGGPGPVTSDNPHPYSATGPSNQPTYHTAHPPNPNPHPH